MNASEKTFGSPSGEPSTTRPMLQQMCEKLWTLPVSVDFAGFVVVMKVAAFFRIERISARDTCFRVA